MNIISLIALIFSGGMLIISIITLSRNSHKDTKVDTRDEAYRQGQLDQKLNNIFEELTEIKAEIKKNNNAFEDFKEKIEAKVNDMIDEAIKKHEAIFHHNN